MTTNVNELTSSFTSPSGMPDVLKTCKGGGGGGGGGGKQCLVHRFMSGMGSSGPSCSKL